MAAKKYTQCFLNKKVLVHRYVYILIASLPFEKEKEFVLSHSSAVGPVLLVSKSQIKSVLTQSLYREFYYTHHSVASLLTFSLSLDSCIFLSIVIMGANTLR